MCIDACFYFVYILDFDIPCILYEHSSLGVPLFRGRYRSDEKIYRDDFLS